MTSPTTDTGFPKLDAHFVNADLTIAMPWYRFLVALWERTGGINGDTDEPIGTMFAFAGAVEPEGYMICDGRELSRVQFIDLFNEIGTAYGAGDGVNTFNIPDGRGATMIGASGTHLVGDTGGSETATLGIDQLPAHTHTAVVSGATGNAGAGTGSAVGQTGSTGNGLPFSIMPPFFVGNWIIKVI